MALMSEEDQQRVAAAIREAESKTSGEIVAVVAAESSTYFYVPFLWGAIAALLVPWPLIYFTWLSVHWIYLIQLAVFLALVVLLFPRRIRYALVPRKLKHERAHRRAVEQFMSHDLHTTTGRTGVLIFVSVAERYAEVLADAGIDAKVPKRTWQKIVTKLTKAIGAGAPDEGFVAAIKAVGALLAEHFPPGTGDPNQLPDHLIVLD